MRRVTRERVQVVTGRIFVILVTGVAYAIALRAPVGIFAIATQYAFSGFAAMLPIVLGALFWRGSTKWGALAVTLWTAGTVAATAVLQAVVAAPAAPISVWTIGGLELITRTPGGTDVLGFMPVVPMTIISALLMYGVSAVTRKPSDQTIARYFLS